MKEALHDFKDAAFVDGANVLCDRCEQGLLTEQSIRTAFWRGEGLVVIRNIPAMVCPTCGEEYVSDRTAIGLDRMRGNGFFTVSSVESMSVPVIDYVDPGPSK